MTRRRLGSSWAAALAVALPGALLVAAPRSGPRPDELRAPQVQEAFPHERHEGLFPLCAGCHSGVLTGVAAEVFPSRALCVHCHDGTDQKTVVWQGPTARPNNLSFDHAEHGRALASARDPEPGCEGCHSAGPTRRMQVALPDPSERCLTCHQHAATDHTGNASCATCHVPLARSGFTAAKIEALPRPTDHDDPAFLLRVHGAAATAAPARCATCHVRERCTACHVDASQPAVQEVPAAPAGMELPTFAARYEAPNTHAAPSWAEGQHAASAAVAACATCHTRDDCAVCHQRAVPEVVASLPERAASLAPGARIRMRAPESHRDPFFRTGHGPAAAALGNACATCHSGGFCAECHRQGGAVQADGEVVAAVPSGLIALMRFRPAGAISDVHAPGALRPLRVADTARAPAGVRSATGFHPADFALRHASAAYGQTLECATCHSVEAFCRTCHQQAGLAPAVRAGPGFHGVGAAWLLGHGQPARQGLESCATCHRQTDCTRCHSTVGAFHVDPHGPSFDAARGWARSPGTCFACHLAKPTF